MQQVELIAGNQYYCQSNIESKEYRLKTFIGTANGKHWFVTQDDNIAYPYCNFVSASGEFWTEEITGKYILVDLTDGIYTGKNRNTEIVWAFPAHIVPAKVLAEIKEQYRK